MASYLDKINQEKMSTESGKIAFCLELLKRYPKLGYELHKDIHGKGIALYDDYSLRECNDAFVYEISRPVEFKPNRYLVKYVMVDLDWETSRQMLDAQPWLYI